MFTWRPMTEADLDIIKPISDRIHVDLPEHREMFAEKLALFPKGCFSLIGDQAVVGYAFSHPWTLHRIPKLNQFLQRLPANADCLLIHDVAISEAWRGQGAAEVLIDLMEKMARAHGITNLALVSVYGTYTYWSRFGFEVFTDDNLSDKLASYGETACYMARKLG